MGIYGTWLDNRQCTISNGQRKIEVPIVCSGDQTYSLRAFLWLCVKSKRCIDAEDITAEAGRMQRKTQRYPKCF